MFLSTQKIGIRTIYNYLVRNQDSEPYIKYSIIGNYFQLLMNDLNQRILNGLKQISFSWKKDIRKISIKKKKKNYESGVIIY